MPMFIPVGPKTIQNIIDTSVGSSGGLTLSATDDLLSSGDFPSSATGDFPLLSAATSQTRSKVVCAKPGRGKFDFCTTVSRKLDKINWFSSQCSA